MGAQDPIYIYADNAATTPLSPRALSAMMPYLTESFGNPGGIHRIAAEAADALRRARTSMANLLGASSPAEIYFTSGGTESDNWILRGRCSAFQHLYGDAAPVRIITSQIEHHAVLHTCRALEREGIETTYLPVDSQGFVSAEDLKQALERNERSNDRAGIKAPGTAIVSVMLANNEIGTIQNIPELAHIAHAYGALFHTDAVQAVGHISISIADLDVDALSLSAHKFHGPRGAGALYLAAPWQITPFVEGGGQEHGMRSGTPNVAAAIGMAEALSEQMEGIAERSDRVSNLRDRLSQSLLSHLAGIRTTGADGAHRLPSIASFVCKDVDAELLMVVLDKMGVAAATGSACSAGSTEPSHVITACGITDSSWSQGTLRLSLADDATPEEISLLEQRVPAAIEQTRLLS